MMFKVGDIVKVLEPKDEEDRNNAKWSRDTSHTGSCSRAEMDTTIGKLGEVIEVSSSPKCPFRLRMSGYTYNYWYAERHLKKAKKWQEKKYLRKQCSQ